MKFITTINVNQNLDTISKGGVFTFTTYRTNTSVGVLHGRFQKEGARVKFLADDIYNMRIWLAQDPERRVLCCFSNYLPGDLKKKSWLPSDKPIVVTQKVLQTKTPEGGSYYACELSEDNSGEFVPHTTQVRFTIGKYKGKTYIYAC